MVKSDSCNGATSDVPNAPKRIFLRSAFNLKRSDSNASSHGWASGTNADIPSLSNSPSKGSILGVDSTISTRPSSSSISSSQRPFSNGFNSSENDPFSALTRLILNDKVAINVQIFVRWKKTVAKTVISRLWETVESVREMVNAVNLLIEKPEEQIALHDIAELYVSKVDERMPLLRVSLDSYASFADFPLSAGVMRF